MVEKSSFGAKIMTNCRKNLFKFFSLFSLLSSLLSLLWKSRVGDLEKSEEYKKKNHPDGWFFFLCKGYKKDIFAVLLTGFELYDLGVLTIVNS